MSLKETTEMDAPEAIAESANRVLSITFKVNESELNAITKYADSQNLARGEWIRNVLLASVQQAIQPSRTDQIYVNLTGVNAVLVGCFEKISIAGKLTPEDFKQVLQLAGQAKREALNGGAHRPEPSEGTIDDRQPLPPESGRERRAKSVLDSALNGNSQPDKRVCEDYEYVVSTGSNPEVHSFVHRKTRVFLHLDDNGHFRGAHNEIITRAAALQRAPYTPNSK